jgi:hypothetical protein
MRKELFGDMSNTQIVGEVIGGFAFLATVLGFIIIINFI